MSRLPALTMPLNGRRWLEREHTHMSVDYRCDSRHYVLSSMRTNRIILSLTIYDNIWLTIRRPQ
jgi:hypothetical protein